MWNIQIHLKAIIWNIQFQSKHKSSTMCLWQKKSKFDALAALLVRLSLKNMLNTFIFLKGTGFLLQGQMREFSLLPMTRTLQKQ